MNGELPPSWSLAQLGECVPSPRDDIVDGPFGSNLKASEYTDEGVPIIRLQNIDRNRFLRKNIKFVSLDKAASLLRHSYIPGDIVITKLGAPLGKAAIVPETISPGVIVADVVRCRTDERFVDKKDLMFGINSPQVMPQFVQETKGTTRPRVNLKHIRSIELPIAPLNEQRRIVEKIETLFARLDKGEEALRDVQKLLARYRQSVLKAAVTGQLTADWRSTSCVGEWREVDLGQVVNFLTSGSRGWAKYYAPSGAIFIRAQNLKYDRLDLEDVALVDLPKRSEGTRTLVKRGDLLVTITGANVTKTALVTADLGEAYVSQHVGMLRLTDEADPEFIYWFLVAKAGGRKQLENFAYGAGKPGLNLTNIREVKLSLPPLAEQAEIVSRIQEELQRASSVEDFCHAELARTTALRQSILKDAFAGHLVPQDPTDEPAATLLARIKEASAAAPGRQRRKVRA